MKTMPLCKQCLQPLPQNAPEGLCPACLAKIALGTEPATPGGTININPLAGQAAPSTEPGVSGIRVPPEPAHLAAQFPQLEIIELLGMGGMGMVYKARQPRLDRIVALKILPVESQQHPSFAERFGREAKALAKLNHPGIVALYEFGQTLEHYYFIMEYVDGMNLRHLLQSQTVAPRQALELVTQICTALQFAHDEGVVHRDIKPENILITKKGQVKIADFGLAKLLGNAPDTALTMSQAAMGTMNYMAPEQRQNAQGVDHRADIYSLGVVFYEMLTGEVPMGRFEPPSKRVQIDVRLDEVVLRALEREPARRYQQASEVRSGVEAITSAGPEAPPTPLGTKPAPDSSAKSVPRFFWLRAYGLFFAGWLMTKLLWNYRSPGCWLACFGMSALVVWVSLKRMRLFPDQLAIYSQSAVPKKLVVLALAFLGLTLGFVFLIGACFNSWEQDLVNGNYDAMSWPQFAAQTKGQEFHLLQGLPAFSQDIPNVEMVGPFDPIWRPGWFIGWMQHGPGHGYHDADINLNRGIYIILFFPFFLIAAWRGPGAKIFSFSWRLLLASLMVSAMVAGSLLALFILSQMAYSGSGKTINDIRSFSYQTNMDTVTKVIQKWADLNGYATGDEYTWNINTVPKGNRVARVRLKEAWKPSPFDRWRSTWISFRRTSPFLAFELVSSDNPAETCVRVTGAMDCTKAQIANETCQRIPEDLISVLDKLESVPSQAHGENDTHSTKER